MPIGATVGAAVVGAGAGIYGSSKAASAQEKAGDQSAAIAQYTADMNNQLARDMYASNAARLDPYSSNGLMASNALTDMLLGTSSFKPGVSPYAGTAAAPGAPSNPATQQAPYTQAQIDAMWHDGIPGNAERAQSALDAWTSSHPPTTNALAPVAANGSSPYPGFPYAASAPGVAPATQSTAQANISGANAARAAQGLPPLAGTPAPGATPPPATAPTGARPRVGDFKGDIPAYRAAVDAYLHPSATPPAGTVTASPANAAWDAFRNSTNYQFREAQGLESINQGYAAHGTLQSGAAQKALLEWNQNFAANELANYQNLLAGQQSMGLGASSALAGVGQNLVNNVSANNNSAGGAAANNALLQGQGQANMWGAVGQGVGQVAGALGSSYGGAQPGVTNPGAINVTQNPNYWPSYGGYGG